MTSLQIQYFLKVADSMSFSRAASELFVSQPSVSRQVRLLEDELGYDLFDRTQKNSIRLTAAGMIFRDCFRRAAADLESAKNTAVGLADHGSLRLHVGIGAGWELSDMLNAFRARVCRAYPQAVITFEWRPFHILREKLQRGEIDAILCTKTSILNFDGLEVLPVAELESRAYVRKGLLRPADEPLRIEDFNGRKLLNLPETESPMSLEIVQIQFQAKKVRVEPVRLPNRETILEAVLMGDGFSVFDQYMFFRDDPRLTYFRLEEKIPVCLVWSTRKQNPLMLMLAEELTSHFLGNADA